MEMMRNSVPGPELHDLDHVPYMTKSKSFPRFHIAIFEHVPQASTPVGHGQPANHLVRKPL